MRSHFRQQRGATLITAALLLLFLLGFMGIALDFGRMFIVKSELQTALDSCALAAARELNSQPDAILRAVGAGMAAGNQNRVNLQSASWNGQGQLASTHISFRDKHYADTTSAALARYAQCAYTMDGIRLWLLQAMGAFLGDSTSYPPAGRVGAFAVATRASAQSACPIPVALQPKTPSATKPDYGYVPGEWLTLLSKAGGGSTFGWANLDGSKNASETEKELLGHCGSKLGDTLGAPGVQASIVEIWNYRFGIYKNKGDVSVNRPDFTGYVYKKTTWPSQFNAYQGNSGVNFIAQRQSFTPCGSNPSKCGVTGSGFKDVATAAEHQQYGADRRLVTVPIINSGRHVIDFACMLMLQPMDIPVGDVQLEYLGNAGAPASPCITSGLAGGTVGPLVPVLVR